MPSRRALTHARALEATEGGVGDDDWDVVSGDETCWGDSFGAVVVGDDDGGDEDDEDDRGGDVEELDEMVRTALSAAARSAAALSAV